MRSPKGGLVLDDSKFERMFRAHAHKVLALGRSVDGLE
jgi:hypothetical protein